MVNLAAPKTLELIEFILEQKTFTQYRAKKELKLSMALVNQVTRYLLSRNLIIRQKSERQYVLREAAALIFAIWFSGNMGQTERETNKPATTPLSGCSRQAR